MEWCALQREITKDRYIDRANVVASRMLHHFIAEVAELAKTNVAEVLTVLQHPSCWLLALAYGKQAKNAGKDSIVTIFSSIA